jgi:hypothetical protein
VGERGRGVVCGWWIRGLRCRCGCSWWCFADAGTPEYSRGKLAKSIDVNFFFLLLLLLRCRGGCRWISLRGSRGVDWARTRELCVVFVVVKKASRQDRRKIDLLCLRVVLTKSPARPEAQKWEGTKWAVEEIITTV